MRINPRSFFGVLYVFAHYLKEAVKAKKPVWPLVRHLPDFVYYNIGKRTPLDRELPWITVGAMREIVQRLNSDMKVFEYGSGGSTLFFAKMVKEVVSVEHDPQWHEVVKKRLEEKSYSNVELRLAPPEQPENHDTVRYPSLWKKEYQGLDFYRYVHAIDLFPDGYFDLILIDGRARAECLRVSVPKLRSGGTIVLDNADREIYTESIRKNLEKWRISQHVGSDIGGLNFSETHIFYRPERGVIKK